MSDIDNMIQRIETFVDRLADEGVKIMQEQVPVGRTGALKASVNWEVVDTWTNDIGSSIAHAHFARYGRGPVTATNAPLLVWEDYNGEQTSVHHGVPGKIMSKKKVKKAPPNNFTHRTATRLRSKASSLF